MTNEEATSEIISLCRENGFKNPKLSEILNIRIVLIRRYKLNNSFTEYHLTILKRYLANKLTDSKKLDLILEQNNTIIDFLKK